MRPIRIKDHVFQIETEGQDGSWNRVRDGNGLILTFPDEKFAHEFLRNPVMKGYNARILKKKIGEHQK